MQFFKPRPSSNLSSSNSVRDFLSLFSTVVLSLPSQHSSKERTFTIDYLNAHFKFSKSNSNYISKHVSTARSPQNPLSVLKFFKQIGFSEAQVRSMIHQKPQILFSDIDKTLRPKIEFFKRVGLESSELCNFISKNSNILSSSLKNTLVPSVEAIRKIIIDEKEFVHVLHKCTWVLPKYQKFLANVALLESFGIVGSQLSMLLKRQPRLFISPEASVRNLVSIAVEMGFHENSRMLVHALYTLSGLSSRTLRRKLEFIQGFGFSEAESLLMFRKTPTFLRTSEKKLKDGIEFFLHTAMVPKLALVQRPWILMYSIENRVLPRYKVLQLLIARNLCKKVPSFISVLCLSEEVFLDKYMSRFRENAEEILLAYKGHLVEA